jgi:hypothetical protein
LTVNPGHKTAFARSVLQAFNRELRRVEILLVRPEANGRTRVRLADLANNLELAALFSAGETHVVFLPAATNPYLEIPR